MNTHQFILSLDGCTVELLLGFGFFEISLFVNLCAQFFVDVFFISLR